MKSTKHDLKSYSTRAMNQEICVTTIGSKNTILRSKLLQMGRFLLMIKKVQTDDFHTTLMIMMDPK
jgi:hypothetical protein